MSTPTQPRLTIAQIALQAKAPVASVMQVVLGLGKSIDSQEYIRIRQIIDQLDSVILSNNANHAGLKHIGVVVQNPKKILNLDYQGVILDELLKAVDPKQYLLVMYFYDLSNLSNLDEFIRYIDGMIVVGGLLPHVAEKCQAAGHPYVLIDPAERAIDSHSAMIVIDNHAAVHSLVQHLVELGHQRIGAVTGEMQHVVARERFAAYQEALQTAGLPQKPEWVLESHWIEQSGYEAGKQLLSLPDRPTAIIAANDLTALGVIRAAREMNLVVGRDVSVTGFDDLPLASADYVQLTTIRQPLREMGKTGINLISCLLQGETLSEQIVYVQTELVVRSSTGKAPVN